MSCGSPRSGLQLAPAFRGLRFNSLEFRANGPFSPSALSAFWRLPPPRSFPAARTLGLLRFDHCFRRRPSVPDSSLAISCRPPPTLPAAPSFGRAQVLSPRLRGPVAPQPRHLRFVPNVHGLQVSAWSRFFGGPAAGSDSTVQRRGRAAFGLPEEPPVTSSYDFGSGNATSMKSRAGRPDSRLRADLVDALPLAGQRVALKKAWRCGPSPSLLRYSPKCSSFDLSVIVRSSEPISA